MIEGDSAVQMQHRYQGSIKTAFLDSNRCTTLRLCCQFVERVAIDLLERCDGIRSHTLICLRVESTKMVVSAVEER